MDMKKFDIYNLPQWLNGLLEELERRCEEELTEGSELYREIVEEAGEIMESYPFLAKLFDNDKVENPLEMTLEEAKALSRFLFLEGGKRDLEGIQMFLMGSRYTLGVLQLLKML